MSTARILVNQGNSTYRFMRFESSSDGSLIAILDRDARLKEGSFDITGAALIATRESSYAKKLPSARFTIHTTGLIHWYMAGQRKGIIQIEPLYALSKLVGFGFVSIPGVSLLDSFEPEKHRSDLTLELEIPEGISERITFLLEIGPKPQELSTFGAVLNYEYSVVVRAVPSPTFDPRLSAHFISQLFGNRPVAAVDKVTAELKFYQTLHGRTGFVFREDGGAYVAMAVVPMARAPTLKITFGKPDLSIEVIPFEGLAPNIRCASGFAIKAAETR